MEPNRRRIGTRWIVGLAAALLIAAVSGAVLVRCAENRMQKGAAQTVSQLEERASESETSVDQSGAIIGAQDGGDRMQAPVLSGQSEPIHEVEPLSKDVVNVLLIGTDSRAAGSAQGGNADTMILASYDQARGTVTLVSFLRDMVVPMKGTAEGYGKLKTAYRLGGAGRLINTLNSFFGLDIQGYAAVGLDGFITLVDETLHGLDVELSASEIEEINRRIKENQNEIAAVKSCPPVTDPPGLVHLNGAQTLLFVRNRSTPVDGGAYASDFDRAKRQQAVLERIYEKLVAENPLSAASGLIHFALKHVETNLSANALYELAKPLMTETVAIACLSVPFDGAWEYGGDGSGVVFDWDSTIAQLQTRLYGAGLQ